MCKRTWPRARAIFLPWIAGFVLAAGAQAETPALAPIEPPKASRGAEIFDVLVVRPLGLAVLPVGVAAFIPTALLTAPNGRDSVEAALELFVTEPANYVFQRPLGEF